MARLQGAGTMNWKPRVLRWPLLLALFLSICLLLSLLEYATHVLPPLSDKTATPHFDVISDNSTIIVDEDLTRRSAAPSVVVAPSPLPSRLQHARYLVGRNSTNGTFPMLNGTLAKNQTSELHKGPDSYQDSSVRLTNVYWWWGVSYKDRFRDRGIIGPGEETAISPCFCYLRVATVGDNEPTLRVSDDGPFGPVKSCRVQLMPKAKPCPTCQSVDSVREYAGLDWQMSFMENDCFQRWLDDETGKQPASTCPMKYDRARCPNGFPSDTVQGTNQEPPIDDLTTVFDVVGSAVVATTLPGLVTVLTRISVGADGHETTLLRTTTLPGELSFYTTATTMHVTERAHWHPAKYVTKTDMFGRPTATIEVLDGRVVRKLTTMTLTDANGVPTATITTRVPVTSKTATLYRSTPGGPATPTATVVEYPTFPGWGPGFGALLPNAVSSAGEFFAGFFAPVLLALLLSLWAAAVNAAVKQGLPFTAMARGEAAAHDSLNLNPGGLSGKLHGFRLLWRFRDPMSLLADLLILLSAVTTVLSSSAVGLKLIGSCEVDDATGCRIALGVYMDATRQVEALLAIMAVTVALMALFLFRNASGISSPPWSIAAIATLLASSKALQDILKPLRSIPTSPDTSNAEQLLASSLHKKRFSLIEGEIRVSDSETEAENLVKARVQHAATGKASRLRRWWKRLMPILCKDRTVQGTFLLLLSGIFSLVLFYEVTEADTPFEQFMDNQGYGVRTLFTTFGVVISFFWDYHCSRQALFEPYRLMSKRPRPARSSILASPSTSPFAGFYRAVSHRNIFMAATSLAAATSKFLPLLLTIIPFQNTQTWMTHLVCAWMTVAILGFMIVVVAWSFCIKRPNMAVEPCTVAGVMWYLCDSIMLEKFTGLSTLTERDLQLRVETLWMNYSFGLHKATGVCEPEQIGVDFAQ